MATVLNAVPDDFSVLAGDDSVALPLFALGGKGVISVAANEVPREMRSSAIAGWRAILQARGRFTEKYLPLMEINFVESNPIPVKAAMSLMGLLERREVAPGGTEDGEFAERFAPFLNRWKFSKG